LLLFFKKEALFCECRVAATKNFNHDGTTARRGHEGKNFRVLRAVVAKFVPDDVQSLASTHDLTGAVHPRKYVKPQMDADVYALPLGRSQER
jgi:hypothetical protein